MDGRELAAIFCGGVLGALARVGLLESLPHDRWPWATLVANVLGAFVLGLVAVLFQERPGGPTYRYRFLGTGLCGALTTFSTLQLELVRMLHDGAAGRAVAYGVASLALGLLAVTAGTLLARRASGGAMPGGAGGGPPGGDAGAGAALAAPRRGAGR